MKKSFRKKQKEGANIYSAPMQLYVQKKLFKCIHRRKQKNVKVQKI